MSRDQRTINKNAQEFFDIDTIDFGEDENLDFSFGGDDLIFDEEEDLDLGGPMHDSDYDAELRVEPEAIEFDEEVSDFDDSEEIEFAEDVDVPEDFSDEGMEDLDENPEELVEAINDIVPASLELDTNKLPGTDFDISEADQAADQEAKEEEQRPGSWLEDQDPRDFTNYLADKLNKIPSHSGNSTVGCERAINYLSLLNREISQAIRKDPDGVIPLDFLEQARDYIENGIGNLKERIRQLNKSGLSKAAQEANANFTKEAHIPRIDYVMTPFERAVSGIIINAVVSGGKPFDDVYAALKKKYDLSGREELAVKQLVMDMGYPIYKDRGTIGEGKTPEDGHGMDFIKGYFN